MIVLLSIIIAELAVVIFLLTRLYFQLKPESTKPPQILKELKPRKKGFIIERNKELEVIKQFTHDNKNKIESDHRSIAGE